MNHKKWGALRDMPLAKRNAFLKQLRITLAQEEQNSRSIRFEMSRSYIMGGEQKFVIAKNAQLNNIERAIKALERDIKTVEYMNSCDRAARDLSCVRYFAVYKLPVKRYGRLTIRRLNIYRSK